MNQRPQEWYEMKDIRKYSPSLSCWVTVKAVQDSPHIGGLTDMEDPPEFENVGSMMFPTADHQKVLTFGWDDSIHHGQFDGGVESITDSTLLNSSCEQQNTKATQKYIPCGYYYREGIVGTALVIDQMVNSEKHIWHLNQGFVLALNLVRKCDTWIRPQDENKEVARLIRNKNDEQEKMQIRREYLLDYLCARKMNLYLYGYQSRVDLTNDIGHLSWKPSDVYEKKDGNNSWSGRVYPIDISEVMLICPSDMKPHIQNMTNSRMVDEHQYKPISEPITRDEDSTEQTDNSQLYLISGELYRTEVIEPALRSERILGEESESISFIVASSGRKENKESLAESHYWLHFKPDVINRILSIDGASLVWSTSRTGWVSFQSNHSIRFGVNQSGHINVFAKDIFHLPIWLQHVWRGGNITPESDMSSELLAMQFGADPIDTKAPENLLRDALINLDSVSMELLSMPFFQMHPYTDPLLARCHRFRSLDRAGLYELAKDLARLIIERINQPTLSVIIKSTDANHGRSLGHLSEVLSKCAEQNKAKAIVSPLRGLNKLRTADAHLPPTQKIEKYIHKAGIHRLGNSIDEAYQLIQQQAETLNSISGVLRDFAKNHKMGNFYLN